VSTRRNSSAVAESGPARAETAVRAYCREACDPAAFEPTVAAVLEELENGSSALTEVELARITRSTTAKYVSRAVNGRASRGKGAAKRDRQCAATPVRLAARANGELDPSERHELSEHLMHCLLCRATRIKMDRAEHVFAAIRAGAATGAPRSATRALRSATGEPRSVRGERRSATREPRSGPREPRPIAREPRSASREPRSATREPAVAATHGDHEVAPVAVGALIAELDLARVEPTVRAYCLELCGNRRSERAVAATLEALEHGVHSNTVREDELLRITRRTAAEHAPGYVPRGRSAGKRDRECAATPKRLAARDNGEIEAGEGRALERHLHGCLACQATLVKIRRAELAFTARAAAAVAIEPRLKPTEPRIEPFEPRIEPTEPRIEPFEPRPETDAPTAEPEARVTRADLAEKTALAATATGAAAAAAAAAAAEAAAAPADAATTRAKVAAGAAAATGAAAAAGAGFEAEKPHASPRARRNGRDRELRGLKLLAAVVALTTVIGIAEVLTLNGGSSHTNASRLGAVATTPAISTTAAASTTPAKTAPAPTTAVHRTTKAKPVTHRAPAKKPAKTHAATVDQPATSTPISSAPVTPAPVVTAPKPVVKTPPPGTVAPPPVQTKPTPVTATPQGTTLPATTAPAKGIGPGGP